MVSVFYGDVVNSINNFGLVVVNISSLKGENITFRFFFGGTIIMVMLH